MIRKNYNLLVLLITFVFGVLLSSVTSIFAQSQANDTIYACVKKNGDIRIVEVNEVCKNKETLLSWEASSGGSFEQHHQELQITLAPGEFQIIDFPRTDRPITFTIGSYPGPNGTEVCQNRICPTIFASGVILIDPDTGGILQYPNGLFTSDGYTSIDNTDPQLSDPPILNAVITNLTSDKTITYILGFWY